MLTETLESVGVIDFFLCFFSAPATVDSSKQTTFHSVKVQRIRVMALLSGRPHSTPDRIGYAGGAANPDQVASLSSAIRA